jgi:hypothetical protein
MQRLKYIDRGEDGFKCLVPSHFGGWWLQPNKESVVLSGFLCNPQQLFFQKYPMVEGPVLRIFLVF